MAVLMESSWYRQILQEGKKIGKAEGLLVGISTGLELKFDTQGLQLMSEIETLESIETLETILKAIKTMNCVEFIGVRRSLLNYSRLRQNHDRFTLSISLWA